jgi:hypothetical protein
LVVALAVLVGGAVGTFLVRNYWLRRTADSAWAEFRPPDGSFSVPLPGLPTEELVGPSPDGSVAGGARYAVRGRRSNALVWVAYNDLPPALAEKLPADRDHVLAAGALQAERDRERVRLDGKITNEFPVRLMDAWGVELHMETAAGTVVERLILVDRGPHPRLYVFGAEAKGLTPDDPACTRPFGGFRETPPAPQ